MRNMFSAGSSMCSYRASCRLSSGAREPEAKGRDLSNPLHSEGHGDLWPGQGTRRSEAAGARDPKTCLLSDCERIKARGFLYLEPLIIGTQVELLFC